MAFFADPQQVIQAEIAKYCADTRRSLQEGDSGVARMSDEFLVALSKNGTLQAELVLVGYDLCGGTDVSLITVAARAVQMTHTYAGMVATKRSMAALSGLHAAEIVLANLRVDAELRMKCLSITNRALLLFMDAQASTDSTKLSTLDQLATESFLNPLHVGMVLANADCAATDAITAFALSAGKALVSKDAHLRELYCKQAATELENISYWGQAQCLLLQRFIVRDRP